LSIMLGWVKDKLGRKQTALEALAANQFTTRPRSRSYSRPSPAWKA